MTIKIKGIINPMARDCSMLNGLLTTDEREEMKVRLVQKYISTLLDMDDQALIHEVITRHEIVD